MLPTPLVQVPLAVPQTGEGSSTPEIVLMLFAAFAGAKVAGEILERLGMPAVVGELGAGILLGPSLLGWVEPEEFLLLLAELGVIVLLFQVGLETRPAELRAVGRPALSVGMLGVAIPFGLGFLVTYVFGYDGTESAFVATALVATSVGVTARVLADMGRLSSPEARIVLGAAVLDDILGLMVLAVVAGLAAGTVTTGQIVLLFVESIGFVAAMLLIGPRIMARAAFLMDRPRIRRAPLAVAVIVLLGVSAGAEEVGLAAIVGAFLAGMLFGETPHRADLIEQFEPIADFLTPFFFVVTGTQIDIESFSDPAVLGLAGAITLVAVAGKLIAGVAGARSMGGRVATLVGIGMVPRGEVGIVVASLALGQEVVGTGVFGAVLAMVVVTTLSAPIALRLAYRAQERPPS